MEVEPKEYNYDTFVKQATGSVGEHENYKIISYHFDRYEIKIKVSPSNEFLEVTEVKLNKDFLSHMQRLGIQTYVDVDKFYQE